VAGKGWQPPELVQEWMTKLKKGRVELEKAREEHTAAEETFRRLVRAAFEAGLSVTPIKAATGLTTSRVYQIKAGRRS
jgi:dihydrodipicolinate synthase/N-acetylneuraminate lyase